GIGGTRMGLHTLSDYNGLCGYKIAEAINTGNYTALIAADSITEFGTYPQQVANALGASALNMGIGGTRMGLHTLSDYNGLCGYKIAEAINTGNY
ncbi:hypothetical protein D9B85_15100, partial [Corynebacterium diphtheriae]